MPRNEVRSHSNYLSEKLFKKLENGDRGEHSWIIHLKTLYSGLLPERFKEDLSLAGSWKSLRGMYIMPF